MHFEVVLERRQHGSARAREIHETEQIHFGESQIKFHHKDRRKDKKRDNVFNSKRDIIPTTLYPGRKKVYKEHQYTAVRI